jgi:hypothetical protein
LAKRNESRWLLLIHQIPPRPNYLRVKVWRRLQRLGAVGIKNSVYVLPRSDQAQEDFQWIRQEIVREGGDASVCEARFVDGLTDDQVEALFRSARVDDYQAVADEVRQLMAGLPASRPLDGERLAQAQAAQARLKNRFAEIVAIDFFGARERGAASAVLSALESRLNPSDEGDFPVQKAWSHLKSVRGRLWVTRKGVHVDRIASAWLIRRFIDPGARFKFVAAKGYKPGKGELRFDMFEAEFTHEGDRCTFEVLIERFRLADPALGPIGAIVHDIDLKDAQHGRPETSGIERLIAGIALGHPYDPDRLDRGAAVLDDLYECFRRKRNPHSTKEDR